MLKFTIVFAFFFLAFAQIDAARNSNLCKEITDFTEVLNNTADKLIACPAENTINLFEECFVDTTQDFLNQLISEVSRLNQAAIKDGRLVPSFLINDIAKTRSEIDNYLKTYLPLILSGPTDSLNELIDIEVTAIKLLENQLAAFCN